MSVTGRCRCGKRVSVADSLAGATVRCPTCGGDVLVGAAAPATAGRSPAELKANRQKAAAGAAVAVSPGIIISLIIAAVVGVIVLVLYLGPWRVGNQWAAMSQRANDDVTDVVDFAIRAYESQHGMYNPGQSHTAPGVDGPAVFVPPMMAFTLPRRIIFTGKTNQGNYIGTYDTTNGEVAATIEVGGFTVGGLVDVRKATGRFQMTGREKDGKVGAEADGHALAIVMRKKPD